jgi:hypothetical protein
VVTLEQMSSTKTIVIKYSLVLVGCLVLIITECLKQTLITSGYQIINKRTTGLCVAAAEEGINKFSTATVDDLDVSERFPASRTSIVDVKN